MSSVPLEEGLKLLFDNLTKSLKVFTMELKEFEITKMETLKRLESINAIKNGEYSLKLKNSTFYGKGLLRGCGEFIITLADAFHNIDISILVNEKAKIIMISFNEIKWLVPRDVKLLNTICEVLGL